jgi:murein DD-endopeptidase MepM/ murein hydrolase activator NlpD
MVVPANSASMKSYHIAHNKIRLAILSVLVLMCGLLVWGVVMTLRPNHSLDYGRLSKENLALKSELVAVQTKVALLDHTLDRLERFDRKLRVMTNFVDHKRKMGIGPVSEEEMALSTMPDGSLSGNEALAVMLKEKLGALESADLGKEIDRMLKLSQDRERDLAELSNFLEDQKYRLAHIPSTWPSQGWITSGFGYRTSPFTGVKKMHEGIDISNQIGTKIYAPADGTVIYASDRGAYGKTLVINHGFGITTRYGHLSEFKAKVGDKVKRGARIATVGNTGRSTGPHLHYEVRMNNIPQNPRRYILD